MQRKRITYTQSGVDITAANEFKRGIRSIAGRSFRPEVLKDIGGFGSFFQLQRNRYKDPVLVSSADGVGTKLKIAALAGTHDTVGIDAVAMNVNDILCAGAEPLFFLDYIAYSSLPTAVLRDIIKGLTGGCREAGCSLIGGETAQMPDMYARGEYDLAGFCVGVVEKKNIIDGSRIEAGDAVIGLASSGIHSNGYSLVRKVFRESEQRRMSKELLTPTRIYVRPVLDFLAARRSPRAAIRGIAHITGGAFYDKIARILPDNVDVRIRRGSWTVPEIFRLIQARGSLRDQEMFHTLNMGIGMVMAVESSMADTVRGFLAEKKITSWIIGSVVKGCGRVYIE